MMGLGLLSGLDQPQRSGNWQPEDWVLLGVKVSHEGIEDEVWFVRLSTLPERSPDGSLEERILQNFSVPFGVGVIKTNAKFTAPVERILIETFDHEGVPLRTSVRSIPYVEPAASLMDIWALPRDKPAVTRDSVAGMMMMLQTMSVSRAVRPIREAVRLDIIKRPKIIGLLLSGLRFTLEADFSQRATIRAPWGSETALTPRQEVTFPLSLTGQKLLDCRMVVGPAERPYNLIGGAMLFEAVHPDKPDNRLTVRVLAAKRAGSG
jgi:hypothetical protein